MSEENRRPRLTNQVLDDLEVAADALTADIEFLAGAGVGYPDGSSEEPFMQQLRANAGLRHAHLVRAYDWLVRYVAAVRAERRAGCDGVRDIDQPNNSDGPTLPAITKGHHATEEIRT